ncbi:MAG: hypothetical protein ABIP17_13345 [Ilumatobacteraceae bacterium]
MGHEALARAAKMHALWAVGIAWVALTLVLSLILAFPYWLGIFIPLDGFEVVPPAMVLAAVAILALPLEKVGDRVLRDFRADVAGGRLRNIADGLAIAIGEQPGHVLIHETPIPNVGGFPTTDGVVVMATTSAIEQLRRDELEALVAAQFAGMREPWCRLATRAELAWKLAQAIGFASILVAYPIGVLVAASMVAVPRIVEASRDLCADVAAVAVTKHPTALANAFRRLAQSASLGNQQKIAVHWYLPVSTFLALPKRTKATTSIGTETGPERTWTDVDEVRDELLLRAERAEALAAGADPRRFTGREFWRRWRRLGTTLAPPVSGLPTLGGRSLPPPLPPPSKDGHR